MEELEEQSGKWRSARCSIWTIRRTIAAGVLKANHKARRNRGDATGLAQATRAYAGLTFTRWILLRSESVSDSPIALQRQLVSDEMVKLHRMELPKQLRRRTHWRRYSKDGSPAKVLLSNTPVDATFKEEANDDDDANDTGKKSAKVTSNVMVKRDGATARDTRETEKVPPP